MIDPSSFLCADHQFLRFRPSILAAVCLAVARRQARIEPLWPARLERKTGFSLNEIADCFNFTWRYGLHLGSLSYQACCPQNSCLPRTWCSHPACKRVHWRSRRERHKRQWRRERRGDTTLGVRREEAARARNEETTKQKKTTKKERKNERDKRKSEDERRDKCIILVNTGWTQQERRRLIKLSASHHQRSWLREAGHEADTPRVQKTNTRPPPPSSNQLQQLSSRSPRTGNGPHDVMVRGVY